MNVIVNLIKKPITWIACLVVAVISGVVAFVFKSRK